MATFISTGLQSSLMALQSTDQSAVDHSDTTAEITEQVDKEELATKSDMIDPSSEVLHY